MAICASETVYQIFLDLCKAYDLINRRRVLQLMEKYGVGKNIRRYVETVWERQKFVLRQGGFYSDPISVERGCTQGDTDSPIIFNLVIDAVLRKWKSVQEERKSRACFYADDGLIENKDAGKLQEHLNILIEYFEMFGLKTNEIKTKYMVLRGEAAPRALIKFAYDV